jgi:hypothetical protein
VRKVMLPSVPASRFVRTALISGALVCAALLFPNGGPFAHSHVAPYDTYGPTFEDLTLDVTFPGAYNRIEDVDFRNSILREFGDDGKQDRKAQLTNGSHERREPGYYETDSLDEIHYLPARDSSSRCALVLYTHFFAAGSSGQEGIAQVFQLVGRRLTLKQQTEWDEHFGQPPYVLFDEKSKTLTFRSAHYLRGDADCCVSAMDVVTMRWDGTRFVKTSVRTELSDYGIREGKKL